MRKSYWLDGMMGVNSEESRIFDIHSHILPVDDGALDLNEALATIQRSYDQGVRLLFASPHSFAFREEPDDVYKIFDELRTLVNRKLPDMHLMLGCEVLCDKDRMEKVLDALEQKILPRMGTTEYVLTEFYTDTDKEEVDYCTDKLMAAGFIPVIAHLERYPALFENHDHLKKMHEKMLFQINAYSIAEEKDEVIKAHARFLLQEKLVDFLGSDTHGMKHRPPMWESAIRYLEQNCGKEYAEALLYKNASEYFKAIK